MSTEIKLQHAPVEKGIAEMRSSIEAMDSSLSSEIDGDNKLDMVDAFNEIKLEYDELLSQFEALFLHNVQATEEAVANIRETEQKIASDMKVK
ncbi:YwqI/YxiC family protein [Virgibacillus halodenitrificans]|uniref:YwqI/YxiC family protein n=1 Tax=Virgibacillus halodenitrificans TaxID=1482 RepID=UPI0024BF7F47|nr:YwqI/YxiC family protein [Virgibacillus halodenitrificans]WHX26448.1 YwqI/YxiC family protein [Virgibacillus halodenitrificans]